MKERKPFDPLNHFDKYKRIRDYKYALEHPNEKMEEMIKNKMKNKEALMKLKKRLEKERFEEELKKDLEELEKIFRKIERSDRAYLLKIARSLVKE